MGPQVQTVLGLSVMSAGAWTALAAWVVVAVVIVALLYVRRQIQWAKQHRKDLLRPTVAMFMEPSAADWHFIELVVKNFGRRPACGIGFDFAAPTVSRYEGIDDDRYVGIAGLNLPTEIPVLVPSQEFRTRWDSAREPSRLGESIEPRFEGRCPTSTVWRRRVVVGRPNDVSTGHRSSWTGRPCLRCNDWRC